MVNIYILQSSGILFTYRLLKKLLYHETQYITEKPSAPPLDKNYYDIDDYNSTGTMCSRENCVIM